MDAPRGPDHGDWVAGGVLLGGSGGTASYSRENEKDWAPRAHDGSPSADPRFAN